MSYYSDHIKTNPARLQAWRRRAREGMRRLARRDPDRRAERYFRVRHRAAEHERWWTRNGFAVVTADAIAFDRTWWQGPGARRERQLERIADELLAGETEKRGPTVPRGGPTHE